MDKTQAPLLVEGSNAPEMEGEIYRIRFDVTTMEAEKDRMSDFFVSYQKIVSTTGRHVENELLDDFTNFVVYSAKRLELSSKAEFVEFVIRVEAGRVKILLETFIPHRTSASDFRKTRENSLRQITFFMPPSGTGKLPVAENGFIPKSRSYCGRTPLIRFLEQSSGPRRPEQPGLVEASISKGPQRYRKHVEEIGWTPCISEDQTDQTVNYGRANDY